MVCSNLERVIISHFLAHGINFCQKQAENRLLILKHHLKGLDLSKL